MDAVTAEDAPRIAGAGTSEAAWRRSPWLAALPERQAEAWVAHARRLVVVTPHPDDETLGCGGIIATARALDIPVRVVAVTDGEACYPGVAQWPEQRLRAVRRQELAQALACLRVDAAAIDWLDLGDGRVDGRTPELAAALRAILRVGDQVLTTWQGDAHPDHAATARAVAEAAGGAVAVAYFPVWAWHWMEAASQASPLAGACRVVLAPQAIAAKQRAIACFQSQLGSGDAPAPQPILPPQVVARFQRQYEVLLP